MNIKRKQLKEFIEWLEFLETGFGDGEELSDVISGKIAELKKEIKETN